MKLAMRFLALVREMCTASLITSDNVLAAVREDWQPIFGDERSLQRQLTTLFGLSEEINSIDLELHVRKLEVDGFIEIWHRPELHAVGEQPILIRCCRTTEAGRRKQARQNNIN